MRFMRSTPKIIFADSVVSLCLKCIVCLICIPYHPMHHGVCQFVFYTYKNTQTHTLPNVSGAKWKDLESIKFVAHIKALELIVLSHFQNGVSRVCANFTIAAPLLFSYCQGKGFSSRFKVVDRRVCRHTNYKIN